MIEKEVLEEFINGVHAQYVNEAIFRNKPPSLIKKAREIYALKGAVMYAKTMEELKAIDERLEKLCTIEPGETPF
ncbi:MAG: hypothetical protein LBL28_02935 [Treponema sp.]|nr:hypothetical protein [Treponema sp.]